MGSVDFNPQEVQRCKPLSGSRGGGGADRRDGRIYVYRDKNITLAVRIACTTRRPILVSGPSGCGKSTLAMNVALTLGWRYYEHVVTHRTEATDLLWSVDTVRRLSDAQARRLKLDAAYVEPGPLWWACDRTSARSRGDTSLDKSLWAVDPCPVEDAERAVVLIDEIDKSDPDVPNALLVPLGSYEFSVFPAACKVAASSPPLVFITTNGERELPTAFVRRCIYLNLRQPDRDGLVVIAKAVEGERADEGLLTELAEESIRLGSEGGRPVSTAEYLDAVRACIELGIGPGAPEFERLKQLTIQKRADSGGME